MSLSWVVTASESNVRGSGISDADTYPEFARGRRSTDGYLTPDLDASSVSDTARSRMSTGAQSFDSHLLSPISPISPGGGLTPGTAAFETAQYITVRSEMPMIARGRRASFDQGMVRGNRSAEASDTGGVEDGDVRERSDEMGVVVLRHPLGRVPVRTTPVPSSRTRIPSLAAEHFILGLERQE